MKSPPTSDPLRKAARAHERAAKKEGHAAKHEIAKSLSNSGSQSTPKVHASMQRDHETERKSGRRHIPHAVKHKVFQRDQGCCTFQTADGKTCDAKIGIQIDHIIPVALGGSNELDNLRLLCRQHNIMASHLILGENWADSWRHSADT